MKKLLLALGFSLLVAGSAFAGGPSGDEPMQQQMAPQGKIVVNLPPAPPRDNTAAYVTAAAVVVAAGIGYLGVRRNRKG